MAFAMRDLSVLAYAQGFTLWHFRASAEQHEAVTSFGFFDAAGDMLAPGDMMVISSPRGGRMLCVTGTSQSVAVAPLA